MVDGLESVYSHTCTYISWLVSSTEWLCWSTSTGRRGKTAGQWQPPRKSSSGFDCLRQGLSPLGVDALVDIKNIALASR